MEWIKCSEGYPDDNRRVVILAEKGADTRIVALATLNYQEDGSAIWAIAHPNIKGHEISHWLRLPPLPAAPEKSA